MTHFAVTVPGETVPGCGRWKGCTTLNGKQVLLFYDLGPAYRSACRELADHEVKPLKAGPGNWIAHWRKTAADAEELRGRAASLREQVEQDPEDPDGGFMLQLAEDLEGEADALMDGAPDFEAAARAIRKVRANE